MRTVPTTRAGGCFVTEMILGEDSIEDAISAQHMWTKYDRGQGAGFEWPTDPVMVKEAVGALIRCPCDLCKAALNDAPYERSGWVQRG